MTQGTAAFEDPCEARATDEGLPKGSGRRAEMADKKVTPKVPAGKAKSAADDKAVARVSQKKMSRKKVSKKKH